MSVPRMTFPPPRRSPPPSTGAPALIAGAIAALVGAGIWTAVTAATKTEFGWIAWGVGGLVGFVMSKVTTERSVKLGILAAVLAAAGLAIGKVATVRVLVPALSREFVLDNEIVMAQAFAEDMRAGDRFSAQLALDLARYKATDTLPPALQARMLDEAQTHMANASQAERERVAATFMTGLVGGEGITSQFAASLSMFDLLFFGLAIATAFKFMRGDG